MSPKDSLPTFSKRKLTYRLMSLTFPPQEWYRFQQNNRWIQHQHFEDTIVDQKEAISSLPLLQDLKTITMYNRVKNNDHIDTYLFLTWYCIVAILPNNQKRKLTTNTKNFKHPKHPRNAICSKLITFALSLFQYMFWT